MAAQGLIGYTQYFTHLPAVLVGFHVVGATVVWSVALWFHNSLSSHPPDGADAVGPGGEAAAADDWFDDEPSVVREPA
jgi:cytochrome c oxidase assembly protein subunit 15